MNQQHNGLLDPSDSVICLLDHCRASSLMTLWLSIPLC
jgi:hypothetical protein